MSPVSACCTARTVVAAMLVPNIRNARATVSTVTKITSNTGANVSPTTARFSTPLATFRIARDSAPLAPVASSNRPTTRRRTLFAASVVAWLTVTGTLAKSLATRLATFSSARATFSAVSWPSSPSLRSSPRPTPRPSAMACASAGVCSRMLFSSSPRRVPLARPWLNCVSAASAACALAPESAMAWLTVVMTPTVRCEPIPTASRLGAIWL
jgi:hypothetical protein